jgi:Protein of unknown function (DUF5674)
MVRRGVDSGDFVRSSRPLPDVMLRCLLMRTATPQDPVSMEELRRMAEGRFGDMVKAVVDLGQSIMVLDAEMHADEEAELLAGGAVQQDLWGINLYPDLPETEWLEFDSMINLRPSFGNSSRGVDDLTIQRRITELVQQLVRR